MLAASGLSFPICVPEAAREGLTGVSHVTQ